MKRYSAFGDTQINLTSLRLRHQRHEFQLSVGEHTVKVVSGNKREAKQMAAQALLKKLHPNVSVNLLINAGMGSHQEFFKE